MASAGPMSMLTIRAAGWGLRTVLPQTMLSRWRSEENANSPVTLGGASGRSTLSPRPGARRRRVKVAGRLGAGIGTLLLHLVERGEDAAVAGAAAQVARDRPAHLQLAGGGAAVEQVGERDDHARDAEAALHGALLHERPLHV